MIIFRGADLRRRMRKKSQALLEKNTPVIRFEKGPYSKISIK